MSRQLTNEYEKTSHRHHRAVTLFSVWRGDEFESHGNMFDGIASAFGRGNSVQGDFTEIPPGKLIKVVAKYQGRLSGKSGNFAPYRLQFGIYTGREDQGRFANVKKHNVLIDVDAAK